MKIVPNTAGTYSGVYLAHCQDERIVVAVGKFLGVEYRHESWEPMFPHGFAAPRPAAPVPPQGLPFIIQFVGTPSDLGAFGYQGCCRRQVQIREVLNRKEVPSGDG